MSAFDLFAVDGPNWFHVLWYPMRGKNVTDEFLRRLRICCETWSPRDAIVAFDSPNPFRRTLYPEYKAGRSEKPPGLAEELAALPGAIQEQGLAAPLSVSGYEADDVLATAAAYVASIGGKCVLASCDKDLNQCLRHGHVSILKEVHIRNGTVEPTWKTEAAFVEEWGFLPQRWIEYQTLVGDKADGLPGCPQIGGVMAQKLLHWHPSLLEAAAATTKPPVSESRWAGFREFSASGRMELMRKLVTLVTDIPEVIEFVREGRGENAKANPQ